MYTDGSASSRGDLDGSADVSGRVSMDPMSKLARRCPTPVHRADFDGFSTPPGGRSHAPVGGTGPRQRRLVVI